MGDSNRVIVLLCREGLVAAGAVIGECGYFCICFLLFFDDVNVSGDG